MALTTVKTSPVVAWIGERLDRVDLSSWEYFMQQPGKEMMQNSIRDSSPATGQATKPKQVQSIAGEEISQSRLLVFAHGTGFCKEVWLPVVYELREALSLNERKKTFVLLIDMAGHGDSDEPVVPRLASPKDANADYIEQALEEFLGQISVQKFPKNGLLPFKEVVGVGHSFGSTSLVTVNARMPQLFTRFVLYEPILKSRAHYNPDEKPPVYEATLKRKNNFSKKKQAFSSWSNKGVFQTWRDDVLALFVENALTYSEEKKAYVLKCRPPFEAMFFDQGWFDENLQDISQPTTVLYGGNSHERFQKWAKHFHESTPNALLVEAIGCDHCGPMHDPQVYLRYLLVSSEISKL